MALLATVSYELDWDNIFAADPGRNGNRYFIPYKNSSCKENNPNYNHIPKLQHCTLFALKKEVPSTHGNTVLCCFNNSMLF